MRIENTQRQWGVVPQLLHWLIVLAILSQLTLGFVLASLSPEQTWWGKLFPLHTTLGLCILWA
jgi:cytochrome b561